ncbi:queuosine salvage family protein [Candidatus Uabimicrobium amorphum]|uniref:Queuosine 5'-phosphate N-glycosylase/hydrolase n=1 Tax=Uabimicrobium amorphum TaxID=2596890 RepID=A0A5S9F5Z0_UABAM|nr:queuosine salvage family protein [Candidatus Uabimicrobium amorphum]BBM87128.1 hypothetical protein UABAM_05531 [Candidatus Uabimicrobium amorphum]
MEIYAEKIIENWKWLKKKEIVKFVDVNPTCIDKYVDTLKTLPKKQVYWDFENIHPKDDFAFARFAIITSAINFCYMDLQKPEQAFTIKESETSYKGAMAMFRCFFRTFGEKNITSKNLKKVFCSQDATKEFFTGVVQIPMLEYRHWIIQELITVLDEKFNGDPINLYEDSNWDALLLLDKLIQYFPMSFQDISHIYTTQKTLQFPFFKKAKLAILLYQGRSSKTNSQLKPLSNFNEIIAVEDYRVPQYLNSVGVLNYQDDLKKIIEKQQIILPHQQMEIEIRAATTVANSLILEKLNSGLKADDSRYWSIANLDAHEWFGAQSVDFPHHITPTTAY